MRRRLVSMGRRLPDLAALPAFLAVPKPQVSVFICGCGHTGTTLLARILATHPDVFSVSYETEVFRGRMPRFADLAVLYRKASESGRHAFVEKTPRHVHRARLIRHLVPRSKFIIATRDGRDVVASLGKRYGDFNRAYQRYIADSLASLEALRLPGSMLWRLEDLIEDPAASLAAVCSFIGIPFSDELLNYHATPVSWGDESDASAHRRLRQEQINKPIRDTRGAWATGLPVECLEWFSTAEASQIAQAFGYAATAGGRSAQDGVHLQ